MIEKKKGMETMAGQPSLLVVDGDPRERRRLAEILARHQYRVHTADDARAALDYLGAPVDLVISELRMGGSGGGLELLRAWKRQRSDTPFLMVTACDEV
jgi:DNA-binding response OmpR family regulator